MLCNSVVECYVTVLWSKHTMCNNVRHIMIILYIYIEINT